MDGQMIYKYNELYGDISGDLFAIVLISPFITLIFWLIFKKSKLYAFSVPLIVFLLIGVFVMCRNIYQSIEEPILFVEGKITKMSKSKALSFYVKSVKLSVSKQTFLEPGFHDIDYQFQDSMTYRFGYKEIGYNNLIFEIYEVK